MRTWISARGIRKNQSDNSAKTGDMINVLPFALMATSSACVTAGISDKKKRIRGRFRRVIKESFEHGRGSSL